MKRYDVRSRLSKQKWSVVSCAGGGVKIISVECSFLSLICQETYMHLNSNVSACVHESALIKWILFISVFYPWVSVTLFESFMHQSAGPAMHVWPVEVVLQPGETLSGNHECFSVIFLPRERFIPVATRVIALSGVQFQSDCIRLLFATSLRRFGAILLISFNAKTTRFKHLTCLDVIVDISCNNSRVDWFCCCIKVRTNENTTGCILLHVLLSDGSC